MWLFLAVVLFNGFVFRRFGGGLTWRLGGIVAVCGSHISLFFHIFAAAIGRAGLGTSVLKNVVF